MTVRRYNPSSSQAERAVQAWSILCGMTANNQIKSYEDTSIQIFGKVAATGMGAILGHIYFWCRENNLPLLNFLVVGKNSGEPGHGHCISGDRASFSEEQAKVRNFKDWYDIVPPTAEELAAAYQRGMANIPVAAE